MFKLVVEKDKKSDIFTVVSFNIVSVEGRIVVNLKPVGGKWIQIEVDTIICDKA